jgi:hypothetical protein
MSMLVISQDHYNFGEAQPGTYELTEASVGTRFAYLLFRTFVDITDPDDIAAAHAAQDEIGIAGGGDGPFEAPNWDKADLEKARNAVSTLSELGFDSGAAFGRKGEVDPVAHLVGELAGWGGQPPSMAVYVILGVEKNDGNTPHAVTVKDVPVDAFWSISLYNKDGFFQKNDQDAYSVNNLTGTPNSDGSYTVHFGGHPASVNYLPIMEGWNYAVRLYQPRQEILDGTWQFPAPQPVD